MKKHRAFPAMVSLILLISLITGCTWIGTEETIALPTTTVPTATQVPTTTVPPVSVQFPLAEEVTLTLVTPIRRTVKNLEKNLADNQLWNDLYERTNVKVEVRALPDQDTLSSFLSMLDSNNYGDILLTQYITQPKDLDALIASHKLLPLNDYVTNRSIMPNLNSRIFDEIPEAKGHYTSPDGNIYFLGSYSANKATYLDTCWINKTWLDMAEMDIPQTLEELEAFFAWVMENDCNGDGDKTDELPYYCYPQGNSFIERLLGMWGLPTTAFDKLVVIKDGKLEFVPQTDGYKDFIHTMNKWLQNGWMPTEYFKGHTNENYEYMMNRYIHANGQPERVAFYIGTGGNQRNTNAPDVYGNINLPADQLHEYICILPPTVEGYETRWYIHPGYMGTRGTFAIAANCKYPEIALAWMDQFYSQEVTERANFGEPGSPCRIDKDGKVGLSTNLESNAKALESKDNYLDQIFPNLPGAITQDEWINRRLYSSEQKQKSFAIYEGIITSEVCPRPIMTDESTQEVNRIYEKLQEIVYQYQSDWITGTRDIDKDWEQYQSELKSAGVDRMVELMQEAYDVYLSAIK